MHRPELVVSLRQQHAARRAILAEDFHEAESVSGPAELQAHQDHQTETEQQEAKRCESVLQSDPLVIGGEHVALPPRLHVTFDAMPLLLLISNADRVAEQPLGVVGVQPLVPDSELFSLCHASST